MLNYRHFQKFLSQCIINKKFFFSGHNTRRNIKPAVVGVGKDHKILFIFEDRQAETIVHRECIHLLARAAVGAGA